MIALHEASFQAPEMLSLPPIEPGLARRIEGNIERRANGRIRDLRVFCVEDRIILTGRARTQYAKQLAQEAALDLAAGHPTLANQIVVS